MDWPWNRRPRAPQTYADSAAATARVNASLLGEPVPDIYAPSQGAPLPVAPLDRAPVDDYYEPSAQNTPRSPTLGAAADALGGVRGILDQVQIPVPFTSEQDRPVIGAQPDETGRMPTERRRAVIPVGETLLGQGPEVLDRASYGYLPRTAAERVEALDLLGAVDLAAGAGLALRGARALPGAVRGVARDLPGVVADQSGAARVPRAARRQADAPEGAAPAAPDPVRAAQIERPNSGALPSPSTDPNLPDIERVDDWRGSDFHRYGVAHGVNNLGPADDAAWEASLRPYRTTTGETITVPGGHDSREPFTYYDIAHLQAQGVNPNTLPDEVHRGIHNRMMLTMTPTEPLEPHQVFNQLAFAQVSPNQPLTPNLMASQAVDAKHPSLTAAQGQNMTDLDRWAEAIPWRYDSPNRPGVEERRRVSGQITESLGIQASGRGGLGVSGNADYTAIAELAQMIRDNPEFFRFRGTGEGGANAPENWGRFVERLMNQVPGLSAKTGSFGAVWQDPARAQISAMDRHMGGLLADDVFSTPQAQRALETRGRALAERLDIPPEQAPRTRAEFEALPGGRGEFIDVALGQIGNLPGAQFRDARTGAVNARVPEHLRERVGNSEPEKVYWLGNAYQRGLDANAARAAQTPGLEGGAMQSIFANQWMLWDRARNRLDPHLMRFPGLDRLPRMSQEQMRRRMKNYGDAGYFNYRDKDTGGMPAVRRMRSPGSAAYWAVPAIAGGGGAAASLLGEDRQQ
jgi:hypothetical protein